MATPGYPMGQMPPMGGAPQGAAPMPRPVRRGTSKAVPVVVSAGLAVGVFCGLLFGVGSGKKEAAAAAPPSASNVKKEAETNAAPAGLGASTTTPSPGATTTPPPTTPTTPTVTAAGSGSGAAAGSGAGAGSAATAAATTPAKVEKKVKLTITVKPEAAASIAKVTVDGAAIEGMSTEIAGDKKQVKVEVKAAGYRSAEKKIDLVGDELTLEIELSKRPAGGTTVHPPKRPDRPPSGNGGLIDI